MLDGRGHAAVLGLDLGRAAGWAVIARRDGRLMECGSWDLSIRTAEGAGMPLLRLRRWIREILGARRIMLVGFEMPQGHSVTFQRNGVQVRKESTKAAHLFGMMAGAALSELEEQGVNAYCPIAPTALKKRATGKGNAGKDAVMEATRREYGEDFGGDDNVADAIWAAVCAREGITV